MVNAQGVKDNLKYTITFFLNRAHFDVERGLYSTAPLKGLVPRAHVHDESDPLTGPDGGPLPRAIVLERGETVAEWAARRSPDASVKAEVRAGLFVSLLPCLLSVFSRVVCDVSEWIGRLHGLKLLYARCPRHHMYPCSVRIYV